MIFLLRISLRLKPAVSRDTSEKVFRHALQGWYNTVWQRCNMQRNINRSEFSVRSDLTLSCMQRQNAWAVRAYNGRFFLCLLSVSETSVWNDSCKKSVHSESSRRTTQLAAVLHEFPRISNTEVVSAKLAKSPNSHIYRKYRRLKQTRIIFLATKIVNVRNGYNSHN